MDGQEQYLYRRPNRSELCWYLYNSLMCLYPEGQGWPRRVLGRENAPAFPALPPSMVVAYGCAYAGTNAWTYVGRAMQERLTRPWTDSCSCNICIYQIPVENSSEQYLKRSSNSRMLFLYSFRPLVFLYPIFGAHGAPYF